ncbi:MULTISPECIES: FadR/GntR family transcriptional regulator [unclassified Blastococcus]
MVRPVDSTPLEGWVRVPKTAEVVADVLRRQIVRGELAEGDLLPAEPALMRRFGVSRPSLREALRVLESEGLVAVRRGARGGVRVCRPSLAVAATHLGLLMQVEGVTLADVFGARVAIEPVAARLLAGSPDRQRAVAELRELLAREGDVVDDPAAYAEATTTFHRRLVEASGNKTLALLWGALHEVLAEEMRDLTDPSLVAPKRAGRVRVVGRLLELVEAGDEDGAGDFWREQLLRVSRGVLRRHGGKTVVDVLG